MLKKNINIERWLWHIYFLRGKKVDTIAVYISWTYFLNIYLYLCLEKKTSQSINSHLQMVNDRYCSFSCFSWLYFFNVLQWIHICFEMKKKKKMTYKENKLSGNQGSTLVPEYLDVSIWSQRVGRSDLYWPINQWPTGYE